MLFSVKCKSNQKYSGVYVQIDKHEWQHLNEGFNIWSQGVAYYFTEKEEVLWFDFEKSTSPPPNTNSFHDWGPDPIYDDGDFSVCNFRGKNGLQEISKRFQAKFRDSPKEKWRGY